MDRMKTFEKKFNSQQIAEIQSNQFNLGDQILDSSEFDVLIKNYQDPKEADKLLKLETTLKEVTEIVHKNLEDVSISY